MNENEIHAAQSEVEESAQQLNQAIGHFEEKMKKGVEAIGKIADTVSLASELLRVTERRLARVLADPRVPFGLAALVIGVAGFQLGKQSRH